MTRKNLYAALEDLDPAWIEDAAPKTERKAKQLPWRKLGGIALAACLAICAVVGVGILMKNATPPVSADPGIPAVCAEQGHDYSIVKEVTTGRIILQCSVCESTKNLYDEIDESEYDSDESHFMYVDQVEAFGCLPDYVIHDSVSFDDSSEEDRAVHTVGKEGDICVIGYTGNAEKVKIPATINGKRVASVCLAYNDHSETITSLIFSEGIVAIYGSTCYDWKNLESVFFSDGLRVIGGYTPLAIQKAVQPDVEEEICGDAVTDFIGVHTTPFRKCPKLTEVYFPEGLVTLGNVPIFSCCTGIQRYYIPDTCELFYPAEAGSEYDGQGEGICWLFVNESTEVCGASGKVRHGIFACSKVALPYEDGYIGGYYEDGKIVYHEYIKGEWIPLETDEEIQKAEAFIYERDDGKYMLR